MTRRAVDYRIKERSQSAFSDCMSFKWEEGWKSSNTEAAIKNTDHINTVSRSEVGYDMRIKNQLPPAFLS